MGCPRVTTDWHFLRSLSSRQLLLTIEIRKMSEIKASRKFNTLYLPVSEYLVFNRYSLASYAAGKVREAFKVVLGQEWEAEQSTAKLREIFYPFTGIEGLDNIAYLSGCKPVEDFFTDKSEFGITVSSVSVAADYITINLNKDLRVLFNKDFEVVFHTQNREATKVEAQYMLRSGTQSWRVINNLGVKDEVNQMIQFLVNVPKIGVSFELDLRNFFSGT